MDILSPQERSERMRRVRSKDTAPELAVRRLVYGLGYRYRLAVRGLPGTPDMVFPRFRKVIFVHGCFWHRHGSRACRLARMPKSRLDYWQPKLDANRKRDRKAVTGLRKLGWSSLVVWECETKDLDALARRIIAFLV